MPTYTILCERGTFRGCAGFDEVYELDGRLYGVVDDPSLRDLGRFYVYPWHGDPSELEDRPPGSAILWGAVAA